MTVDPNFSKLAALTDALKVDTNDAPTKIKALAEAVITIEKLLRKGAGLPPAAE